MYFIIYPFVFDVFKVDGLDGANCVSPKEDVTECDAEEHSEMSDEPTKVIFFIFILIFEHDFNVHSPEQEAQV